MSLNIQGIKYVKIMSEEINEGKLSEEINEVKLFKGPSIVEEVIKN